jgi:hypothetical protein
MKCKIRIKTPIFAPISEELYLVDFKPKNEVIFITEFGEELFREDFDIMETIQELQNKQIIAKTTHEKIFYIHMQIIKNNE